MKRLLFLGFLGLGPTLAEAQTPPSPTAVVAPVDTSALAYYASKHDTARVDAELRRLRTLYPNWQPPADPMAVTAAPAAESDDKPLWDLFGADKLDELDAEIARHKAAEPTWNPPEELVAKLAAKRARSTLIAASDRKDFAAVVDLATKHPELVVPDDLDLSWRVAEAYGRMGATDKALKIDQAILTSTQDPAERLATVRKAMVTLGPNEIEKLVTMGKPAPDGRSEFDAVDLDLVRQRVGHVLGGSSTDTAAPADVARLEAAAARPGDAIDAALLGWLYSKKQEWSKANGWFQAALKAVPEPAQAKPEDAKVAQGAVLALKNTNQAADAEALAYRWRDADPALALLYLDSVEADLTRPKPVALAPDRLKQFGAVTTAQQSGDGAQALGWYAYNVGQYKVALAWFQKAMAWQPRDTTALGLAFSLRQTGDKAALAAFLRDNAPTFPSLAALTDTRAAARAEPASEAPRKDATPQRRVDRLPRAEAVVADAAPAQVDRPRPRASTRERQPRGCKVAATYSSPSAALQTGWCLLELKRAKEAALAFAAARESSATRVDAAYGQALADLRNNRTDEAVAVAASVGLPSGRRNEIGLAALAQTAATAFDEGRYKDTLRALNKRRMFQAEPRDLTILRAWSTYHTGHSDEARSMFTALDAQLSTSESRSGIAATNQTGRN